ncbi:MAG: Glu/Leu/Phe/Val dehydrogenase [Gammaproteobacteria bacterium]|jgi:glutamate dehydrogenase (NAD(P)+)|nr:Glu/Leu/Phe/Val dehydrogenase [Gammaproteobacteria bacterium]
MNDVFELADGLGPAKIIHVYEPSADLKAILVVDNVAKGPAIGGVRMAEDVSTEECFRLARAMTLKNAAAGLPYGGGKIVLYGDPRIPKWEKEHMLRALASSLRNVEEYIFAPDMGTDEECMAWIRDEIGRAVGLPREIGGIPLDEIGATGWGLSNAADVALRYCDFELEGAKVAIQGFGAVGKHTARYLQSKGAIITAVADSRGAIHNPDGLDIDELTALKAQGEKVSAYKNANPIESDAILDVECDIWIPAARPDVIHADNAGRVKAKLIIQGANIPVTHEAEKQLAERGVLCVPDFIANAGGVICAAMEYAGSTQKAVFEAIEEKVRRNTEIVLDTAKQQQILPRQAAVELATDRVRKAMHYRQYSLFSRAPRFI